MKFLALTSKLIYKLVCALMISYANSSQFPMEISSNIILAQLSLLHNKLNLNYVPLFIFVGYYCIKDNSKESC